jgi:hypothetical protein
VDCLDKLSEAKLYVHSGVGEWRAKGFGRKWFVIEVNVKVKSSPQQAVEAYTVAG